MDGLCHFIAAHILRNWTLLDGSRRPGPSSSIWTFPLLSDGNTINIRDAADSDEVNKLCRLLPFIQRGCAFRLSRAECVKCLFFLLVRAATSSCVFDGLCHFFSVDLDGRQSRTSFVSKLLDDAIIYWASLAEYCAGSLCTVFWRQLSIYNLYIHWKDFFQEDISSKGVLLASLILQLHARYSAG
jgi:hypothetical protein